MSSYKPSPYPGFGSGLNLRDLPDVVGPAYAIDLANVTFTERGAVKSRDGYDNFTAAEGTNRYDSMTPYYTSGGTRQLVVGAGNRLEALNTSGAIVASSTAPTASPHFFARFGGATAEVVYAANGTDQVRQWNGSAWSTPAWSGTAPTGRFLAVTPWDNRLVNARRGGTTAGNNPSSVRFSDQGVPTTFGANNYHDVTPGDGESIMGAVQFGPYVIVFKETRYFVFYGTSTAADGNPVFEKHTVEAGVGPVSSRAICVSPDGVYFLARNGVYKVTGPGQPVQVSDVIDPFFLGGVSDFYTGGVLNHAQITKAAMTWHEERVYLAVPTASANDRLLVYDIKHGWWSLFDIPAAALVSFRVGDQPELVFAYASGLKHVGRHSSAYTTDDGATITSHWQGGWFDLGSPDVKRVPECKLWGAGKVSYGLAADFQVADFSALADFAAGVDTWSDGTGTDTWADGADPNDPWGAGGVLFTTKVRRAQRGTVFSLRLDNYDATPWTLARATHQLAGIRETEVTKA